MDSSNQFIVGANARGEISIQRAPIGAMRRDEALNLAAWLRVLADPEGKEFERIVEEIEKS